MTKTDKLSRTQLFIIAMVLLVGLTLSLVGSQLLFSYSLESQKLWIERQAESRAEEMQLRINAALESLTSIAALFYSYDDVGYKQFTKFVEIEAETNVGTLVLAWVPHLLHDARPQFERSLIDSTFNIKMISEFNAHGLLGRATKRDEYFPVQYIYSIITSDLFPGLNLSSFYKTRKRLNTAIETNTLLTTKRITLDRKSSQQTFRAFLPVYDKNTESSSSDKKLVGFAMGQFDITALSQSETYATQLLHMTLLDIDAKPDEQLLFTTTSQTESVAQINNLNDLSELAQPYWTRYFNVGNRKWLAVYSPYENLPVQTASFLPYIVLILGVLITSLLAIYLFIAQWRTHQVKLLKDESEEKSRFLQAVGHDLRQPLHTLELFVSQLQTTDNKQHDTTVVPKIKQTLSSLNNMFDTLLDMTRLDASVITPKKQHFKLQVLLNNLSDEFEINAENKGLDFRLHVRDLVVYSDPILLERILRNIIVNAIRYTQQGKVLLACRQQGSNIKILVMDTGVGIPVNQIETMFDPYVRGKTIAGIEGLGLGLAIVKQTADLLEHRIEVKSVPGSGSSFSILVPMGDESKVEEVHSSGAIDVNNFTDKHILLVEDDEDTLRATEQLLLSWGIEVTNCKTCEEAETATNYNLIISDYHLPDGNGLELIQSLKKGKSIKAILMTSDSNEDIARQAKANDDEFLRKPIQALKLKSLLNYYFSKI